MAWATLKHNASRFVQAFNTETRIACRSWTIHWLDWCWLLLLFDVISGIYQASTLLDMPLAVIDKDHSRPSRKLIRDLDATFHVQVITAPAGVRKGLDTVRQANAYTLLYIPPNFEIDVLGGRTPKAKLYYSTLLYSASCAATQDFSTLVVSLNGEPCPRLAVRVSTALPYLTSISVSYDSLFNASSNYTYYQQLVAIIHLLQLLVIVIMVHVPIREAPELRASSSHILWAKALGVYLMGKLTPYMLLFTTLLMLEIFLPVTLSGTRINSSPLVMPMITLFYVIAAQNVGLVLFIFAANRSTAYLLVGMLTGVTQTYLEVLTPELAIPIPARVIVEAEPLIHTLYSLFDQLLRQASLNSALYTCAKSASYPPITYMITKMRLRSHPDLNPIWKTTCRPSGKP